MSTPANTEPTASRDRKRYHWALQVVWPLLPAFSCVIGEASGSTAFYWLPLLMWYGLTAALDHLIPIDNSSPTDPDIGSLEADAYYRWLIYVTVPFYFVNLVYCAWFVAAASLPWHAYLGISLSTGLAGGLAINTGHELGHKSNRLERWLARLTLAVTGYGHFHVEHNLGHHRAVATPQDSASARMGESIYAFARREIPGGIRRAWTLEKTRLAKIGKRPWDPANRILQPLVVTLTLYLGLIGILGAVILPFLVIQLGMAWWQLTSANYVEHYGLLRARRDDGRYEPCQPRHSWNSNHVASNLVLFNLQRHSDHHANPYRRYQALRAYDDLPELPSGYPAMFALAMLPPLWRRVMDERVLRWAGHDIERVNLDPRQRRALIEKYRWHDRPDS